MKPGENKRVCFVDDEADVRDAVAMILSSQGYAVRSFADGQECLTHLEQQDCDLLITDIRMPSMDGMMLLSLVRQRCPDLPVILVTGVGDIPMAVRAIKIGAADFLEKPLRRDELLHKVRKMTTNDPEEPKPIPIIHRGIFVDLTDSEWEVMWMILQGKSSKEIADFQGRSVRTVEVHRAHIMKKYHSDNIVDLVNKYWSSLR
ncbi:MAG: response regulator transcription factor [Sedimentisphaerales bacterium]|nr:response regulator transcription factor [Sedimentisphaerales bacterium]